MDLAKVAEAFSRARRLPAGERETVLAGLDPAVRAEVEARGRRFDPMSVGVTRSINVVMTEAERQKAVEARVQARLRVDRLAQRPDGQNKASIMSYAHTPETAEASALYGTPDEIAAKLQRLRDLGAEYVLINSAGGLTSLRRFAQELMPAFAGPPAVGVEH